MTEMDITDSTELILIDTFFTHLENPNNHLIQEKEVHISVGQSHLVHKDIKSFWEVHQEMQEELGPSGHNSIASESVDQDYDKYQFIQQDNLSILSVISIDQQKQKIESNNTYSNLNNHQKSKSTKLNNNFISSDNYLSSSSISSIQSNRFNSSLKRDSQAEVLTSKSEYNKVQLWEEIQDHLDDLIKDSDDQDVSSDISRISYHELPTIQTLYDKQQQELNQNYQFNNFLIQQKKLALLKNIKQSFFQLPIKNIDDKKNIHAQESSKIRYQIPEPRQLTVRHKIKKDKKLQKQNSGNDSQQIFKIEHTSVCSTQKTGRQPQQITKCIHVNEKHYAKGMCNSCYHDFGRKGKATECLHTEELQYAKGMCKRCYFDNYNQTVRKRQKIN